MLLTLRLRFIFSTSSMALNSLISADVSMLLTHHTLTVIHGHISLQLIKSRQR